MKKNQSFEDEGNEKRDNKFNGRNSMMNKQKMKKNMQRLGGKGLSLEAFANAKSMNNNYNPSIIKKQREFYKNAKYVKKYKRSLKQQEQQNGPSKMSLNQQEQQDNPNLYTRPMEHENETAKADTLKRKKNKKDSACSLKELYEKKREEEEKARMEREAIIQAKKEERQKSEARRKALREKMFKKTKSGQPVMKYRIEHLLETIQSSNN